VALPFNVLEHHHPLLNSSTFATKFVILL